MKEFQGLKHMLASKGLYDDSRGKELENKVLIGFLRRLQFGYYQIIQGERPDFTLNFSRSGYPEISVGCEITYYFSDKDHFGSKQARFVNQWKRFAKKLRAELDKSNQEYLYGAIHFKNPDFKIMDKFDNSAFISEIVNIMHNKVDDKHAVRDFNEHIYPLLAQHVDHIYIKDTAPEIGTLWWPSHLQSGKIPDPTNRLIEIVSEKNMIGREYNWGSVADKWLIIYSGVDGVSDMVGQYDNPNIRRELGLLCFDRVYLWNKYFESIDEIYPQFHNVFSKESKVLHRGSYPSVVRSFIMGPSESTNK